MASSKARVGGNLETSVGKESKSIAGGSAGETSPSPNARLICLHDLDTIATVGESHLDEPLIRTSTTPLNKSNEECEIEITASVSV